MANALAVGGSTTERGSDNNISESLGTLLVGDDCEIHKLKTYRQGVGICGM